MLPWADRAVEEATLFNPAFCATLLAEAAGEFMKKAGRPLPFSLTFLILPIVLHGGTRSALPGTTVTALLPWVQDHREQLVVFGVRVQRLRAITREAIMFGTGLVSRAWPVQTAMRNCTRDEGGPFEVGNQVLTSSHRKLLSSKAMVVNVAETSGHDPGRHD
jgi:hypothetical protein